MSNDINPPPTANGNANEDLELRQRTEAGAGHVDKNLQDTFTKQVDVLDNILKYLKEKDGRGVRAVKEYGAAYSAVAIFVASIGVGLLSYANDTFSERTRLSISGAGGQGARAPAKTTDHAVNILWFLTVILSGLASFTFAFVQGVASVTLLDPDGDIHDARKRPLSPKTLKGFMRLASTFYLLSMFALFAGILVFVWAERELVVALPVSVAFGAALLVLLIWSVKQKIGVSGSSRAGNSRAL